MGLAQGVHIRGGHLLKSMCELFKRKGAQTLDSTQKGGFRMGDHLGVWYLSQRLDEGFGKTDCLIVGWF